MPDSSLGWQLVRRPHGAPVPEDFALVREPLPEPADGEVVVVNSWLSVDPYMRGRMDDRRSYAPPYALGEVMDGGAVGTVVASRSDAAPVGATVLHGAGWREAAVLPAARVRVVDVAAAPAQRYLGALGMVGLTAYAGLVEVAPVHEGDTVFVTAAAGAVGSLAGQLARLLGAARVVGSASAGKLDRLTGELGYDAAFDRADPRPAARLAEAAPDGVDVVFDNVGGAQLEAAIGALRVHGRAALCGAISGYNATEPQPGPRNLALLVARRATLRGFLVGDHEHLRDDFVALVAPALADGRLHLEESVHDGVASAVEAFSALMRGDGAGKVLVRVG